MRQIWIISTLLILIIGCEQKTSKRFIDPQSRQVEIDFAHVSVSVPKIFQRFSPDELIYAIENLDSTGISESERIERVEGIERMKTIGIKFYIYVDTTNIYNTIIFYPEKYLRLDKDFLQYYIPNSDKSLKSQWSKKGISVRRVDTQFFTEKRTQVLKLKYEITRETAIGYSTSYVVTTSSNSFVVIVTSSDAEDYEDQILHMRIGI